MEERARACWIAIVIVLSFGVTVIAGQNGLLSARCVARCLTEHRDSLRGGTRKPDNRNLINKCENVSECYMCMKPCSVPVEELVDGMCEKKCLEHEGECEKSCQFLFVSYAERAGSCPSPESAVGFEAVCVASCSLDGGCPDNRKCCLNTCGKTCREPVFDSHDHLHLPPVPNNISLEERREGRALKVTWILPADQGSKLSAGEFLYVLECRNTTSQKPSFSDRLPWLPIVQTLQTGVLLRQLHAGHWYQYRVAAVSQDGTQGFFEYSTPYKSSRSVKKPLAPQNLTEGATTLHNGQVDVEVLWEPPKYSDLPIWKYMVTWSERLSSISPVVVRLDVLEKSVPGYQHKYKLKNLKPGTTYLVEIEAIAQQGNKRWRSKKTSLMLTTYSPPKPDRQDNPFESKYPVYADLIKVQRLQAQKPYFHHGFLKASLTWRVTKAFQGIVKSYMIYWEPESCDQDYAALEDMSATTHDTSFEIYNLQFECHYMVKVIAVTKHQVQSRPSVVHLYTPVCRNIRLKGDSLPPECPKRVPQVPKSPDNVSPRIERENCSITLRLSWQQPSSDLDIESYVIEYGIAHIFRDVDRALVDPVYQGEPIRIVVSSAMTQCVLRNLEEMEHYVIKLSAMSEAGLGEPAYIEIWTPQILPCGSDKDPEPPDKRETTRYMSSSTTSPTEGSTLVESTSTSVSKAAVTMATNIMSHNTTATTAETVHEKPKDNIYKAVAYLFFVIGRLISDYFK